MRTSGILMPVFSLPSPYGIGTFGKEAYRFVDFLDKAGQSMWQILPLGPTSFGDSPYQSFSSFAGNPYFIDPDMLIEDGLLTKKQVQKFDFGTGCKIDYGKLYENRLPMLKLAFENFVPDADYKKFCSDNSWWLEDYVLFSAIKGIHNGKCWSEWEEGYRLRDEKTLSEVKEKYADTLRFYRFIQYEFNIQWTALKKYANKKGIKIIGDLPIYVAYDSADVWADTKQFLLKDGLPTLVAGCPPDAFSKDGQLWGNPIYDWEYMEKDGYKWWIRRINYVLELYDVVRIDHFRGFESFYAIPYGDKTAKNGKWMKGPDMKLFEKLGKLPIIAEDLGFITPQVRKLLKNSGFPGMKVLQFAFDTREESDYLPHNYDKNCVVYTGTHDNDTIIGWTKTADKADVEMARRYLQVGDEGFNWAMMRAALMSVADTAILMMPDLLGLGSEARINTPSKLGGNWNWRIGEGCTNDWLAKILYDNTLLYGRIKKQG
ncbi:MAG: 4-alpha-glucanotransferase [Clostridia bacterium]|nr:4-alpha-glucanotransferase [Clostridia bacterium]